MSDDTSTESAMPAKPVERLFPFVLKTRGLVVGRDALRANRGKLHFVLITEDIGEANREEVLRDFTHYPVVQHFQAADLEKFFNIKGAKAVGFLKSGLAQSIYAELKEHRLNKPPHVPTPPKPLKKSAPPVSPSENP
jgi:ribosomal protein L7Ae-like RNA K-turn-binding protein